MPLTLFDFVQQVDNVTVDDIPDSTQDSINDELNQQTGGGGGTDINNPSDVRTVANTVTDLNGRAGFTSIQDAIDGANPENGAADSPVGSDGTIFVEPGTYQGPVQIVDGETNLTIRSTDGAGSTTIDATEGNAQSVPSFNAQAVRISADGVTIDGFEILGDDTIVSGVFIAGGSGGGDNVEVLNNIIEGMSRPGFGGPSDNSAGIVTAAFGGGDPEVIEGFVARNNSIRDIGNTNKKPNNPDDGTRAQGITLIDVAGDTPGDGAVIEGNDISNLAGQDTTRGIAVQPLDRPTESGTNLDPGANIQNNNVSGADVGLFLGDSGALNIANNTLDSNPVQVQDNSGAVDLNGVRTANQFSPTAIISGSEILTPIQNQALNVTQGKRSSNIQSAVDDASIGDRVVVGPGTFNEDLSIGVDELTLEGPNAGIAGDNQNRGSEATITAANSGERLELGGSNVKIDGFNFEFGEQAIRSGGGVDALITNNRFELTAETSDGYAIRAEESATGIDVTNNLFSNITSNDGTDGDNANGVVLRDPNGSDVLNNNFSSVDTAVNIGSKTNDTASGTLLVKNNDFSDITQFGAVLVNNPDTSLDLDVNNNTVSSSNVGIFVFNASDNATFAIDDNSFQDFGGDDRFVDDQAGVLDLGEVKDDNQFSPTPVIDGSEIASTGVRFNNQSFSGSTDQVTVERATAADTTEFVLVAHKSSPGEDGVVEGPSEIGGKIGSSDVLTGTPSSVNVDLTKNLDEGITEITQTQTLITMLHVADNSGGTNFGSPITRNGTPVFDQAEVTINK